MSDDTVFLNYARRYFTQAGQASDLRKMRMLAELGLEYLGLAQHGARGATPPPAPDQGGTGQADN